MLNKKINNKKSSSFLTTTPEKGKETALKLLNKYAESFNSLKEENATLKQQIKDLNLNIKINKSIIDNFFSDKKLGEKAEALAASAAGAGGTLYHIPAVQPDYRQTRGNGEL